MAETQLRVGLRKQDFKDQGWHTSLNAGFDAANLRLTRFGSGDPNGVVASHWIGQRYFDEDSIAFWVSLTDTGVIGTSTWVREIPRGTVFMFSGDFSSIPAGYALCDGSTVSVGGDDVDTPDLSGRFIVGADAGDADYNTTDPIGDPRTGGDEGFTVVEENIEKFTFSSAGSEHSHNLNVHGNVGTGNFARSATDPDVEGTTSTVTDGAHGHEIGVDTPTPGENRPPYYVLAYIMKL